MAIQATSRELANEVVRVEKSGISAEVWVDNLFICNIGASEAKVAKERLREAIRTLIEDIRAGRR